MNKRSMMCMLLMSCVFIAFKTRGLDKQVYRHPALNFQFEASPGWQQVSHPEDDLIYEMVSPDGDIHVMLWYTATMQDAKGYLLKMADLKELNWSGNPVQATVSTGGAWQLNATGEVWGMKAQTTLRIIHRGYDPRHKDHNALYIAMIWCEEYSYNQYESQIENILETIQIGKRSD